MIVNFSKENNKINWWNLSQTKEEAEKRLNENTVWIDSGFPDIEQKEGFNIVYFYKNGTIIAEYEAIEDNQNLTQLDIIQEAVLKKNEDIAQTAIDSYTLELIEGGLL